MNFTREPIIETVITPREGCKLLVRSSKVASQEEYQVDAVEVVSFGHSLFFRSLEKPKSFFVPVSDYEILELRETRVVLKNAPMDRSIKIGGGRDAPVRSQRETPAPEEESSEASTPSTDAQPSPDRMHDRKQRDRRRRGRRGGRDRQEMHPEQQRSQDTPPAEQPSSDFINEMPPAIEEGKAPSFISKLFPPPPTLIKETLSRYKPAEISTDPIEETPRSHKQDESKDLDQDSEQPPQETHFDD